MKNAVLSGLLLLCGYACANSTNPGTVPPMQPAPSAPAPLSSTCACGGDRLAPDHATGCPCAGHQSDPEHKTCGCGTGSCGAGPADTVQPDNSPSDR